MAETSAIEWTDATWNPWMGCQAVSPACAHCYAKDLVNGRLGGDFDDRKRTAPSNWLQPARWNRKARRAGQRMRVFTASLADWMDNQVPIEWLVDALEVIRTTEMLDWLLLTKRPEQIIRRLRAAMNHAGAHGMDELLVWLDRWVMKGEPPENVWLGITAEDQDHLAHRAWILAQVPAKIRFLSVEPMLGPINIRKVMNRWGTTWDVLTGRILDSVGGPAQTGAFHWVIAGGESGPKARPSAVRWFMDLWDQCNAAQVAFLFKQYGEWAPAPWKLLREEGETDAAYKARSDAVGATHAISFTGHARKLDHAPWSIERAASNPPGHYGIRRVGKKAAGRLLEGFLHDGIPS